MPRCCALPRPTSPCRTTSSSSASRSHPPSAWSPPRAACSTSTDSPVATNVYMEALSPTMEEGRVAKWHKREGDAVKAGETLAEVETDKAVMDLVARADGVLRQVAVAGGRDDGHHAPHRHRLPLGHRHLPQHAVRPRHQVH